MDQSEFLGCLVKHPLHLESHHVRYTYLSHIDWGETCHWGDWSIHRFKDDNVGLSCSSIISLNRTPVWWVQCSVGVYMDQVDLTGDHQSILDGRGAWSAHKGFDSLVDTGCLNLGHDVGARVDGKSFRTCQVFWDGSFSLYYHQLAIIEVPSDLDLLDSENGSLGGSLSVITLTHGISRLPHCR